MFLEISANSYFQIERLYSQIIMKKVKIDEMLVLHPVYAIGPYFQQSYSVLSVACWVTEPLDKLLIQNLSELFDNMYNIIEIRSDTINNLAIIQDDDSNNEKEDNQNSNKNQSNKEDTNNGDNENDKRNKDTNNGDNKNSKRNKDTNGGSRNSKNGNNNENTSNGGKKNENDDMRLITIMKMVSIFKSGL
ncbi:hypothetical protein C2G38_59848 [Gigaspora rosea]|uniref:Uncharacterized protein n=1 Tax=Gigaspora rosea TaxID=44941 RepID=A0A397UQY0_9GLOM|nr:hypothetical protein C2G38_59848 [Gigaspora rosea]